MRPAAGRFETGRSAGSSPHGCGEKLPPWLGCRSALDPHRSAEHLQTRYCAGTRSRGESPLTVGLQRKCSIRQGEKLKAHIVGGGLASLSAAAYLIRDGKLLANNIFVYEASEHLGGAMRITGSSHTGYILPTGRVFEREFRCAFDLFSLVPSVSDTVKSIKEEILSFNERYGFHDKAHVIDRDQQICQRSTFWFEYS